MKSIGPCTPMKRFACGGSVKVRSKGFAILASAAAVSLATVGAVVAGADSAAAAAPVLLSRNQPVTVSSAGGCCPGPNAVDGNAATRWASAANIDPSWIYVDLGATASITRVRLQWDASCATAYRVETSGDHANWSPIFSTTTDDGGVD